jgi:hypothetical protein
LFSIFGNCNTYFGTTAELLNFSPMYGIQVQQLKRQNEVKRNIVAAKKNRLSFCNVSI